MSIEETRLKNYFPMLRSQNDIISDIESSAILQETFASWNTTNQQYFLDICSGVRGVKMLYDSFFKEILNPESTPSRLSDFLSLILMRKVTVTSVLPNDTVRLSDEMSLVITDIVVEMEDKTIANIEVQKIGYAFPGERASCYSADLLLRQYKRVRDERKQSFTYKDLAPVYTIVLMEKSPKIFHDYPDDYVHYVNEASNTGIKLNMLQNFIFIPIDIFLNRLHNRGITNELDAWLTFLGCDDPRYIIQLIHDYPQFKPMYTQLYDLCLNIEKVMSMFSKELQLMDQNTVKYMMDEYQEQVDNLTNKNAELSAENTGLATANEHLTVENESLTTRNMSLTNQNEELTTQNASLSEILGKYKEKFGDL